MTKNRTVAKTPTVAIARVLRDIGLVQGTDFRVKGDYRNGERVGTYVDLYGPEARQTVATFADEIEELVEELSGFAFQVSITYSTSGNPFPTIANTSDRVREAAPVSVVVDEPTSFIVPADAEAATYTAPRVVDGQVVETINPYDGLPQKRFGSLTWACREARMSWFFQNTLNDRKYELRAHRGRASAWGWYLSDGAGAMNWMGQSLTDAAMACESLILQGMRT